MPQNLKNTVSLFSGKLFQDCNIRDKECATWHFVSRPTIFRTEFVKLDNKQKCAKKFPGFFFCLLLTVVLCNVENCCWNAVYKSSFQCSTMDFCYEKQNCKLWDLLKHCTMVRFQKVHFLGGKSFSFLVQNLWWGILVTSRYLVLPFQFWARGYNIPSQKRVPQNS